MIKKGLIILISLAACKTQRIPPTVTNGQYSFTIANQVMEVDPAIGGRITSLKIDGKNFLTDSTVNKFNWGSTFWPSPQSDWKWPPSAYIDNMPYTATINHGVLKMVSQQDPKTGLIVTKEFSANRKDSAFILKFIITNRSDSTRKVAPWEVTRVHTRGLAFFPIGQGERTGGLLSSLLEQDGISWFVYQRDKLPVKGDRQIYADGAEGWMAQLNDGVILIKKFPDIPIEKTAPKEGEVELFASASTDEKPGYVEIEHQGAYETLKPGESSSWTTVWYLRKVPAVVDQHAGSKTLVEYVRNIIR